MVTLLSTNGQSLNTPRVQEALRAHPPTYLIVAIDGLTDQTNSVYRKGARLAPALDGVRSLADWKQRTGARFPVLHCRFMAMRQNEHELPSLRGFATDTGFDMVSLRSLSIIDSAEDAHRNMVPADELLRAYRYERGERVQRHDFVCQHAFSFPTLLADGTVVSCEQDFNGSQPYGVLKKGGSFRDIWLSPGPAKSAARSATAPANSASAGTARTPTGPSAVAASTATPCGPSRCERTPPVGYCSLTDGRARDVRLEHAPGGSRRVLRRGQLR